MRKLGGEGVKFAINTSVLTKKTVTLGYKEIEDDEGSTDNDESEGSENSSVDLDRADRKKKIITLNSDTCPIMRDAQDNYNALERHFGTLK